MHGNAKIPCTAILYKKKGFSKMENNIVRTFANVDVICIPTQHNNKGKKWRTGR
jgi:hypothetical protein